MSELCHCDPAAGKRFKASMETAADSVRMRELNWLSDVALETLSPLFRPDGHDGKIPSASAVDNR